MDKIEKIRQEIERRLKKAEYEMTKASGISHDNFIIHQAESNLCRFLLGFLDTLLEEPDKDLKEEVNRYYFDNFAYISSDQPTLSILTNIARHFAEWGAIHLNARKEEQK